MKSIETQDLNRQGAKVAKGGREREEGEESVGERVRIEPEHAVDELARRVIGAAIEVHRHPRARLSGEDL